MPLAASYPLYTQVQPTDEFWIERPSAGTALVAAASVVIYDVAMWYPNNLPSNAFITVFNAVRTFTLPIGMVGSKFTLVTAPSAPLTLGVYQNGTQIGTINFGTGQTVGTATLTAIATFNAGDQLKILTPAATLGAVSFAATFLAGRVN